MRRALLPAATFFALLTGASVARSEARRIAVVVGNNAGTDQHPPLRFAESDAGNIASVLAELGGVAPADLLLLQGRRLAEVRRAIETASARSREWHGQPDARVIFLFYFSGHSDGVSLEIGAERLAFPDLKTWISGSGADVRLLIVDSCRSGSLLESKGGVRSEPFEIHFDDDLRESGEAVITSSAANESALESAEIRGSFFTHHFVSGLRGAADASGDGQVTLAEAYRYAFSHTASATADTLAGVQHPSYDYRLSGQGELVLTELRARSASLTVPAGYRRVLITDVKKDEIAAELTTGARMRVALLPGSYGLHAWRGEREFVARVELGDHQDRVVAPDEMSETASGPSAAKGTPSDIDSTEERGGRGVVAVGGVGLTTGIGRGLGPMPAARLGVRWPRAVGITLDLDAARATGPDFTESRGIVLAGYRWGIASGAFAAFAGAKAGGGVVAQSTTAGDQAASPIAALAPAIEGLWWMHKHLGLGVDADVLFGAYEGDGRLRLSIWPAGYVGLVVAP